MFLNMGGISKKNEILTTILYRLRTVKFSKFFDENIDIANIYISKETNIDEYVKTRV